MVTPLFRVALPAPAEPPPPTAEEAEFAADAVLASEAIQPVCWIKEDDANVDLSGDVVQEVVWSPHQFEGSFHITSGQLAFIRNLDTRLEEMLGSSWFAIANSLLSAISFAALTTLNGKYSFIFK